MKLINQYKGLRKELYYLFIGRVITAMGSFVMPMLILILKRKLGFSPSEITIILTVFAAISLPATIIGGKLTDFIGRKKIIIIFDLITVAMFIISGLIPISFTTVILIMLGAFFAQIEAPAYDALIADFSLPKDREKAYSLGYLGWNLGFVLGPTLGGFLFEDHLGLSFIINGIATLATTIIIIFFIHEKNAISSADQQNELSEYEKGEKKVSIINVLKKNKTIFYVLIVGSIAGAVYSAMTIMLPMAMEEVYLENGATYYGLASSFNGLVVIIFTPILTILIRRWKELSKMGLGVILFSLGLAFFFLINDLPFVFIGMFVFTIGEIVNTLGSSPYMTKRIPASHRGRIFSTRTIIAGLIGSISQLAIGFLLEKYTYNNVFIIYIVLGLICGVIYWLLIKKDKGEYPKLYNS